jgi:hypothetical protein
MLERPPSVLPGEITRCAIGPSSCLTRSAWARSVPNSLSLTSALAQRSARMASVPRNSVISESTTRPPCSTSQSATAPTAGLAVRPDMVSDPPHSMARVRCSKPTSSRSSFAASSSIPRPICTPRSTARSVPPTSWMPRVSIRLPSSPTPRTTSSGVRSSQPSPTISTAATFGCPAIPESVRIVAGRSAGPRPQPSVCVMVLTAGSSRPMASTTPLAQLTELITNT